MTAEAGSSGIAGNRPLASWIVFLVGLTGVIAGTIGIRTAHDVALIKLFDNLHWTSGTASAAILGWLGYRRLKGTERGRTILWFALGLTLYAVGQIAWDIQTAMNYSAFPTPSDLFYIWLGPGLCAGFLQEIFTKARKPEITAIMLDILALSIASLTLVLALYLPRQGNFSLSSMAVLTAYPATLLTAVCIGVAMIPSLRLKNSAELWLFLCSIAVTAWSWMTWNLMALAGTTTDGSWFNVSFSYSVLFMGLVIGNWKLESSCNPAWERICEGILRLAPLVSVIAACGAVLATAIGAEVPNISEHVVALGAALVILLSAVRQVMLLKERDLLLSAQKEIIVNRALLRTVIDAAPVRVFWKDLDCRYLGCNAAFAADAGVAHPDDIVGKTDDDLHWRDEAGRYQNNDREVMASGLPKLGYEEPLTTLDGRVLLMCKSKVPLKNGDDGIIGIVGVYENITDRKWAEERLRTLNESLEQRVKERTAELEEKNSDLEKMLKAFVGRELRMMELKERIRELEKMSNGEVSSESNL